MADTVGQCVMQRLGAWGAEWIYGYPGDGINGLIAGMCRNGDQPRFIQARHEELAAGSGFGSGGAGTQQCDEGGDAGGAGGINACITVAKYWKEWKDPRWITQVLKNRDLNRVTWEQRMMMGDVR
jgi:hypothetical protein